MFPDRIKKNILVHENTTRRVNIKSKSCQNTTLLFNTVHLNIPSKRNGSYQVYAKKPNIFCIGNYHLHTFYTSAKYRVNPTSASWWFSRLKNPPLLRERHIKGKLRGYVWRSDRHPEGSQRPRGRPPVRPGRWFPSLFLLLKLWNYISNDLPIPLKNNGLIETSHRRLLRQCSVKSSP